MSRGVYLGTAVLEDAEYQALERYRQELQKQYGNRLSMQTVAQKALKEFLGSRDDG
jgi:hypothetical protein